MSHIRTIGLGTITGTISNGVSLAAGIITVPLLVRALGTDAYGLLGVVSSLVGFVGMADLGLTSTITNAMSYAKVRADHAAINRLYSGGFLLYTSLMVGLLLLAAFVLYTPWFSVVELLRIPPSLAPIANIAILIMLGYTMMSGFWGGIAKSVYHGMQEVAVYNIIQACYNCAFAIAFIGYLLLGDVTVLGVVVAQGIGAFVRLALLHGMAQRRYSWLRLELRVANIAAVRPLLRYSLVLFVSTVCIVILERSDNLVIAHYLGVGSVTAYAIAYKLFYLPAAMLPIATASAPVAAALYAQKAWDELSVLYRRILRVNILLKFTVFAILLMFAEEIIGLWVGRDVFAGYGTVAAITGAYVLFAWNGTHSLFFGAMQKYKPELRANLVSIALNVALSIYLVQRIGMAGVALGTLVSLLAVNAWYLPWALRREAFVIHPMHEAGRLLVRIIPMFAAFLAVRFLIVAFVPFGVMRYAAALLGAALFAGAVGMVGFSRSERSYILRQISSHLTSRRRYT